MIKSWKLFLENKKDFSKSVNDIFAVCDMYGIEKTFITINNDGTVDVDGNVDLSNRGLTKIPLNFGKVSGDFLCYMNKLTSLEGCPREVEGDFWCSNNLLKSLEFAPQEVFGFYCSVNQLVSLNGLVKAQSFAAEANPISNLTILGQTMIKQNISFIESVILNRVIITDDSLKRIFKDIDSESLLELNDFKVFNFLRTHLPEKWGEVMSLRDVDVSADLGELGF